VYWTATHFLLPRTEFIFVQIGEISTVYKGYSAVKWTEPEVKLSHV